MGKFTPQLSRREALTLAKEYDVDADGPALEAGAAIRRGDYSPCHLRVIFDWKTKGRGRSRLDQNAEAEMRDALQLASSAETPRAAIAVLQGLYGVHTPVASAIMTMIDPDKFTILDFRALEALGTTTLDRSLPFYLEYLTYCVGLARSWRMSLRDLDRALWQWSANQ